MKIVLEFEDTKAGWTRLYQVAKHNLEGLGVQVAPATNEPKKKQGKAQGVINQLGNNILDAQDYLSGNYKRDKRDVPFGD